MSKSILVMDMPERCSVCEFLRRTDEDYCYCGRLGFDYQVNEYMRSTPKGKPDWCPLVELPQKMAEENRWFSEDYAKGRNDCIDEILKGDGAE